MGQNFELAVPVATQSHGDAAGTAGLADRAGLAGASSPAASAADEARIPVPSPDALRERFLEVHESAYGYANPHDPIEIVNVRLTARGRLLDEPVRPEPGEPGPLPEPFEHRTVCFAPGDATACPVYERGSLRPGNSLDGPAIVEQLDSTTPIFPRDTAVVDRAGNLVIRIAGDDATGA